MSLSPPVSHFPQRMEEEVGDVQVEEQSESASLEENLSFNEVLAGIQNIPPKTFDSKASLQYDLRFAYLDVFISKIDEPPEV